MLSAGLDRGRQLTMTIFPCMLLMVKKIACLEGAGFGRIRQGQSQRMRLMTRNMHISSYSTRSLGLLMCPKKPSLQALFEIHVCRAYAADFFHKLNTTCQKPLSVSQNNHMLSLHGCPEHSSRLHSSKSAAHFYFLYLEQRAFAPC